MAIMTECDASLSCWIVASIEAIRGIPIRYRLRWFLTKMGHKIGHSDYDPGEVQLKVLESRGAVPPHER